MTSEIDKVALKLKGYNCRIRFVDNEDLYLKVDGLNSQLDQSEWLADIEQKINGYGSDIEPEYGEAILPIPGIAIRLDQIKYIEIF